MIMQIKATLRNGEERWVEEHEATKGEIKLGMVLFGGDLATSLDCDDLDIIGLNIYNLDAYEMNFVSLRNLEFILFPSSSDQISLRKLICRYTKIKEMTLPSTFLDFVEIDRWVSIHNFEEIMNREGLRLKMR